MSDLSYSARLRELSKDYYQSHLAFEDYRAQRKEVLDKIDEEFNGHRAHQVADEEPDDPSALMKTIAFFKDSDID